MFTNALLSTMQILVAAFGFMLCVCVIKSVCVYLGVYPSVCGSVPMHVSLAGYPRLCDIALSFPWYTALISYKQSAKALQSNNTYAHNKIGWYCFLQLKHNWECWIIDPS